MAIGMGGSFGMGGLMGMGAQQGMQSPQNRSGFGQFLFGNPERYGQMSRFSPQNQSSFDQLIQQILGQYQSGQQGSFEPIAEQARSGFQTKTLPSIMERLTSMGGGGGRSSASFNVPAQAGADFELGLNAQRAGYDQQQQSLLHNLMGLGQQEPFYQPRTQGIFEQLFSGGLAGGGQLGGQAVKLAMLGL